MTDPETGGLVYMRARYYDPGVGRFVSEDPAGDGSNWYTYCDNNPANEIDGNGKVGKSVEVLIGMRDWTLRLDRDANGVITDIHILFKGNSVGSYFPDPQTKVWKHGSSKDVPNSVRKAARTKGYEIPAYDTVTASLENDPLGTVATLLDIAGDDEDAAMLDRINESL